MLSSKDFIKYLKTKKFPDKNYYATSMYPGTEKIDGKHVNYFNEKYIKKKFLHPHEDKNINSNVEKNKLFNNSFDYISKFQNNLLNKNIENYISGGAAYNLYSILTDKKNNIFDTKDYDLYLYYDEVKITNKIILNNVKNITNSIIEIDPSENFAFIELFMLLNFENKKKFKEVLEIFLDDGYDLHFYNTNDEQKKYDFKFLKVINKELCIRVKIQFKYIERFINEKIYNYTKITHYYIKKLDNGNFKTVNKFIPIECLIKNKNKSNIELMKSSINLNNNTYYIYNLNTLLYNLMHLYYKYQYDTENNTIVKKRENKKNVRDKKRLKIFFEIYCKILFPKMKKTEIKLNYNNLLLNDKKFNKSIEKIKNFDAISKSI